MRYDLPCEHDVGMPLDREHLDFHPLTYDYLKMLLSIAQKAYNAQNSGDEQRDRDCRHTYNSIQCRLGQAIPGMTCPHPIDGPVSTLSVLVDEVYLGHLRIGDLEAEAGVLANLLSIPRKDDTAS